MEFIGLTLHQLAKSTYSIFSGFGTKARVSQADKLASIKVDLETKLALDLQYTNARTQIENSIVSINNQRECKASTRVLTNTNNNYIQGLASLTDYLKQKANLWLKQLYHSAIRLQTSRNTSNKSKGELKH
jgi:hypothetical protein